MLKVVSLVVVDNSITLPPGEAVIALSISFCKAITSSAVVLALSTPIKPSITPWAVDAVVTSVDENNIYMDFTQVRYAVTILFIVT